MRRRRRRQRRTAVFGIHRNPHFIVSPSHSDRPRCVMSALSPARTATTHLVRRMNGGPNVRSSRDLYIKHLYFGAMACVLRTKHKKAKCTRARESRRRRLCVCVCGKWSSGFYLFNYFMYTECLCSVAVVCYFSVRSSFS